MQLTTRALGALTLSLALGLTGCSNGSTSSAPESDAVAQTSTSDHNDADVTFATDMIPHHHQALMMVAMTKGRPMDPEFQTLTEDIRDAQTPEIALMSGWLGYWGEDVPSMAGMDMDDMDMQDMDMQNGQCNMGDSQSGDKCNMGDSQDGDKCNMGDSGTCDMEGMGGMGMDGMGMDDMPGMMSPKEMAALGSSSDAKFQDMWLDMMIRHHEGAIEMGETQVAEGLYQPSIDLAEQIITSQTAEIALMKEMLG